MRIHSQLRSILYHIPNSSTCVLGGHLHSVKSVSITSVIDGRRPKAIGCKQLSVRWRPETSFGGAWEESSTMNNNHDRSVGTLVGQGVDVQQQPLKLTRYSIVGLAIFDVARDDHISLGALRRAPRAARWTRELFLQG